MHRIWPICLAVISLVAVTCQGVLTWVILRDTGQVHAEATEMREIMRQHEALQMARQETNNLRFAMLEAWRKDQERTEDERSDMP